VSEYGIVSAKAIGSAIITATTKDGKKASVVVTVVKAEHWFIRWLKTLWNWIVTPFKWLWNAISWAFTGIAKFFGLN
jgi:hypothetical protein